MCSMLLHGACGDSDDQPKCERTLRICEWNADAQDFNSNCRYAGCADDAGAPDGQTVNESDASTNDASGVISLKPAVALLVS